MDLGHRGDRAALEGGDRGEHLEHGTRLEDVGDDGVDEARGILECHGPVVVGVVGRIARLGHDRAAVRVEHDRRDADRRIGGVCSQHLLLDGQLQVAIDGQPEVRTGHARADDLGRIGHRAAQAVTVGEEDLGRTGQLLLVPLLYAVLTLAVVIHEAQQMRSQRGAGRRTLLRVDPDGLRFQTDAQAAQVAVGTGAADAIGGRLVHVAGEDDVRPACLQCVGEDGRRVRIETQDGVQRTGSSAPFGRRELIRGRHYPVAGDGRGQHHGARTIEDRATSDRLFEAGGALAQGGLGQAVVLDHLPPRQTPQERHANQAEGDQDDEQAWPGISPSGHAQRHRSARSIGCLASRDDKWLGQLVQTQIDGLLANGRAPSETVQIGQQLLGLRLVVGLVVEQPVDVVASRRHANALRQREEGEQKRQRDRPEQNPDATRAAPGPGGPARSTARESRAVDELRQEART